MRPLISSSGPSSLLRTIALSTSLLSPLAAALSNDFSSYPSGSQNCLTKAADSSKCSGSTGQQLNECLCTNKGNFVYNTASCVAKASPSDLDAVYATLNTNCAGTGVTLTVSKDAFMAKAAAATAVTTTSKPTKTKSDGSTPTTTDDSTTDDPDPSPTNSSTAAADASSWSSTAKVGVGVGIGVGASALILLFALLWRRYRRRKQWKQSGGDPGMAPMGGGREYHQPGIPHAPSSYVGSTYGGHHHDGGSTVAGSIAMQHTGGSNSNQNMAGSWHKPPVSPMAATYDGRNSLVPPHHHHHAQQGQPLLAELGGESLAYQPPSSPPVELPAQEYQQQPQQQQSSPHSSPPVQTPFQQKPFSPHDFGRTNN
ncbi:hypothetical protein PG985_013317 [Apiospora marii]|uniref:uncharacterized protein n=1 Tax=Apiospora marii TaxID=335849 RepID=UPI003130EBA4